MKILLLGSSGFVGNWIREYFLEGGHEVVGVKCDVTDKSQVFDAVMGVRPVDVVINATGKTGVPNVDWCEDHREETTKVNIVGAINVADVCRELGLYLVQIGSGCIFLGDASYAFTEEDRANFFGSFYSQTKAICESVLREYENVCVLRIRIPIQGKSSPKNLLDKLLKYQKIVNIPNSVTIMEDLMPFIEKVCERRLVGVLNATNPGVFEHKMLLELYREIVDPSRVFEYVEDYSSVSLKAQRSNCLLSSRKCEELGIVMPEVGERLREIMEEYRRMSS